MNNNKSNETPLITVAIALCNNRNTIKKCIESVINQTYKDIEILVIDDGSHDDSLVYAKDSFSDNRLIFYTKENGGLSSSRQFALDRAAGKYICFIDADDFLSDGYIEELYSCVCRENADIAICSTAIIDQYEQGVDGQENLYKVKHTAPLQIQSKALDKKYWDWATALFLSDSWNKMFRVDFIRRNGITFSQRKGYNGSDYLFNHKIILHDPKYAFTNYTGYYHIVYELSAVHRKKKNFNEGFQVLINQLIVEAEKVKNEGFIEKIIPYLYLEFTRKTIDDLIIVEKENSEAVRNYIKQVMLYIEKQGFKYVYNDFQSKWLLLYWIIIKSCRCMIYPYIRIRRLFSNCLG